MSSDAARGSMPPFPSGCRIEIRIIGYTSHVRLTPPHIRIQLSALPRLHSCTAEHPILGPHGQTQRDASILICTSSTRGIYCCQAINTGHVAFTAEQMRQPPTPGEAQDETLEFCLLPWSVTTNLCNPHARAPRAAATAWYPWRVGGCMRPDQKSTPL